MKYIRVERIGTNNDFKLPELRFRKERRTTCTFFLVNYKLFLGKKQGVVQFQSFTDKTVLSFFSYTLNFTLLLWEQDPKGGPGTDLHRDRVS